MVGWGVQRRGTKVNKELSDRGTPLLRVKAKFTVKNPVCNGLGHPYTAFLTVIFTFALKSGFALTEEIVEPCLVEDVSAYMSKSGHEQERV